MDEQRRFTANLLLVAILMKSSYACCPDKPVLGDSCYVAASQIGVLSWSPPQSCRTVDSYEVLYTHAMCSTTNAIMERLRQNETTFIAVSSEAFCIKVRAIFNEGCFSSYSTCAQVAPLKQDQYSLMLHGEVCLQVYACQQQHPSNILFRNTWGISHFSWRALLSRQNVNLTYNHSINAYNFCFRNVTESFLFLEYCEVSRVQPCDSSSTFCCNSWVEFVARTCVNVNAARDGECSDFLLKPLPPAPTLTSVYTEYDSSGLMRITSLINTVASVDISGGFNAGSVISYTFIYNDGSVFPPTFVVPSANCSASVCEHVFNIPTSSVPPFYTVSVTATNVMGEGPVTISPLIYTQNSSLGVIILPNNTILCLHNEQPAANCSIHYGTDSSNLPYTDSAVDGGVITLTSNLTGNATHYIMSTAIGLLTVNLHGSFSTCTTQDLMVSNLTVQPQSNCGWPTGDDLLACYSGVTLGSTVVYYCANSSLVRVSGKSSRTCQSNGTWSGTTPSCVCNGSWNLEFDCDFQFPGWTPTPPQATVTDWFVAVMITVVVLTLILVAMVAVIVKTIHVKRKHDIPETHGPVYDEVGPGPKNFTNAQQLLEMKENIAYGPKAIKIKENPAYKAVEKLKP